MQTTLPLQRARASFLAILAALCLALWLGAAQAQAQSGCVPLVTCDTTAPTLVSLTVAPMVVEVSAGSQTVTVTAHILDDLGGAATASVRFDAPGGTPS